MIHCSNEFKDYYNVNKMSNNKLLLVLDLDETLVSTTFNNSAFDAVNDIKKYDKPPSLIWENYYIFLRPFVNEFLNYCLTNYNVAIWTASSSIYANKIVDLLFGKHRNKLKFIYTRDHTLKINKQLGMYAPITTEYIKQLKKVQQFRFSLDKTLVIDDNPESYSQNVNNAIHVQGWYGESDDKELLELISYLRQNFENTNVNDVRLINKYNWKKTIV